MRRFLASWVGSWWGRSLTRGVAFALVALAATSARADDDALAFDFDPAPHINPTSPWYLPRQVMLGVIAGRSVTPQLRVGWELTVLQERRDALMFELEAGGGWAVSTTLDPDNEGHAGASWFFEHSIQAGMGYRDLFSENFAWGFRLTGGPAWIGARSPGLPDERNLIGVVEGRLELGHYFDSVQVGVTGGFQSIVGQGARRYAPSAAGGGVFGIFVNWR